MGRSRLLEKVEVKFIDTNVHVGGGCRVCERDERGMVSGIGYRFPGFRFPRKQVNRTAFVTCFDKDPPARIHRGVYVTIQHSETD
jgi:hypothetical protein